MRRGSPAPSLTGLRIGGGRGVRHPGRIAAHTASAVRPALRRWVFAGDYVALPAAGLYQPIWEYDARTLAWDLGAHLAYGAGTGMVFWPLARIA